MQWNYQSTPFHFWSASEPILPHLPCPRQLLMPVSSTFKHLALEKWPPKELENPHTNCPELLAPECSLLSCPQKMPTLRFLMCQRPELLPMMFYAALFLLIGSVLFLDVKLSGPLPLLEGKQLTCFTLKRAWLDYDSYPKEHQTNSHHAGYKV